MTLPFSPILCKRTFSTSLPRFARKAPKVEAITPELKRVSGKDIPPYPYGPNRVYKQANRGLYGGGVIQFGNKISTGKNEGKTRRTWRPNVNVEKLWSDALNKELSIKVRHRVLRTIKKVGGLDNYLLGEKPARIKELGIFGWKLRWLVMQAGSMRKRFKQEKRMLGLPKTEESFGEYWDRRKEELLAEREQVLVDREKERRARERRLNGEEEEEWEDEEDVAEEEHDELAAEQVTNEGESKAGDEKPKRFMQEEMPVKEK